MADNSLAPWHIILDKSRATWCYYTRNPEGGGFGSNYCGPQYIALARARRSIPEGARYSLAVNGRARGVFTRGAEGSR